MPEEEFFRIVRTEIVCRREETESSRKRAERVKAWLNEVLSRPEVLAVAGWVQYDCEDTTYETPMFIIFVREGALPPDDQFEASEFYSYRGVEHPCPGLVWNVVGVERVPTFTDDDIAGICWCGDVKTFTIWVAKKEA